MKEQPAFPTVTRFDSTTTQVEKIPGMTLRDYFAGQVIEGLAVEFIRDVAKRRTREEASEICKESAVSAYAVADAMMKARDP